MNKDLTRKEIIERLKTLGAKIGRYELKRRIGEQASIVELRALKKEFKVLSKIYKERYFKLI